MPSVTRYFTLNKITNLGTFVLKRVPHIHTKCTRQEVIENPLVYHNFKFFSVLRSLSPGFGTYELEKAVRNLFIVVEQEFSINVQILEALQ